MSENKDKSFINETVKKRKMSSGEVLKRSALFFVKAITLGLIATVTFLLAEPVIRELLENNGENVVKIDDGTENTISVENSTTEGRVNENPLYDTKEGMSKLLNSIVQIEGKINILDEKGEILGEQLTFSSGAVVSTGDNTIILTDYESVKDSEIIKITFSNELQCTAKVKSYNKQLGIAVISADTQELFDGSYFPEENVFGDSGNIDKGEELMYIGVSEGVGVINVSCDTLTTNNILQYTDVMYSMFTTDLASNVAMNGFLYNSSNQLVGMIAQPENNGITDLVAALGSTDIMPIVEKLSNDKPLPYMGINGSTVTDELKEYVNSDMPYGVYVTKVDTNSPAYEAGILNGDIITEVSGKEIDSVKTFSNVINSMDKGNVARVNVERYGKNEYKNLTFSVIIGGK
ncbi:MAG: PDZ domain-containing protein [Lachnospira sp.]|nr:PDZ domain-containing protein [Lachnospira sp.]